MAGQAKMRAPGFYSVRQLGVSNWTPAMWTGAEYGGHWFVCGDDKPRTEDHFTEIGPRIPSPDERPISRSPAAPAGEVEAAVAWARGKVEELLWRPEDHDQKDMIDLVATHLSTLITLASAATRAAQERRAGWQPIETADKTARIVAWETDDCEAVFAKHDGYCWRHDPGGWPVRTEWWQPAPEPPAIRALPIPDEEQKA